VTAPDPYRPPVMPGHDWPQAAAPIPTPPPPAQPKRWGLGIAVILGVFLAILGIGIALDASEFTPEEAADEAKQACTQGYVPAKLAAMADPESARFTRVEVTSDGDTYKVAGLVNALRISNDSLDGLANRYRFECSLTRTDGKWVTNYSNVLPV
jgi:hypothetical protein